jgi:hypothetical protein
MNCSWNYLVQIIAHDGITSIMMRFDVIIRPINQPTKYKMLIRMDDKSIITGIIKGICFKQNIVHYKTGFICWEL